MLNSNFENIKSFIEKNHGLSNIIEKIINDNELIFIPYLTEINNITFDFYFFFTSNNKKLSNQTYFLKIFSSLLYENNIKTKKLIFQNSLNFIIKRIILHQKNQNQILFLNDNNNVIGIISNISDLLNENIINISIPTINFQNEKIISLKFSFFDNYFGVLLENNKFLFYNVESQISLFKYNYFKNDNIIDFNFFSHSFKYPSLEYFSVIFMNEKGQFEIFSPLIPPYFNIEDSKFKELQKLKKENEQISNIILEFEKSININNNQKLIQINCPDLFNNIIKNLSTQQLKILNLISNYKNDNLIYDGIYILNNTYPYIIIRTSKNIFDIIILSSEINLTLKNNNLKEEKIDLFVLESFKINYNDEGKIKFREYENCLFVNLNNNICIFNINYINELNKIIHNQNLFIDELFTYKFHSYYNQITKSNNQNNFIIPTPYMNNFILILTKDNYKIYTLKFNINNLNNDNLKIKKENQNQNLLLEKDNLINELCKLKNDYISISKNINSKSIDTNLGEIKIEENESENNILNKINISYLKVENEIKQISYFYKLKIDLLLNLLKNINSILVNLNNKKEDISEQIDSIEKKKKEIKNKLTLIFEKYEIIYNKINNIIQNKINKPILNENTKNILFTKLNELKEKNQELNNNLSIIQNYNLTFENIIDFKGIELNKTHISKDLYDKLELFKNQISQLFSKIKNEFNEIENLNNNN